MSFLTIRSLSARPRRRLVLGRDVELDPISPNEIDDLGRANERHVRRQARKFGVPRGGAVKEKFCKETRQRLSRQRTLRLSPVAPANSWLLQWSLPIQMKCSELSRTSPTSGDHLCLSKISKCLSGWEL